MVRRFILIRTFAIVDLTDKILKLVKSIIRTTTPICATECIHISWSRFHKFDDCYFYSELLLIRLRDQSQSQIYLVSVIV